MVSRSPPISHDIAQVKAIIGPTYEDKGILLPPIADLGPTARSHRHGSIPSSLCLCYASVMSGNPPEP